MTFFYNLNQKLDEIRATPEVKSGQLNERANSPVEEGRLGDMARKVGGAVKRVAGKALDTLGHGSDEDMIRDLQRKSGVPQTGMKPGSEPNPKVVKEKMSPSKAKSFAALAEPKDKITFADKIAGAKKEVDEMLGDVAAEAMKSALSGHSTKSLKAAASKDADADKKSGVSPQYSTQQVKGELKRRGEKVVADESSQDNAFTAHKRPRVEKPAVGTVTHGRKHDVEEIPGGRRVTRRVDPSGISVGADDEAAQSGEKRGRGRPKKAGGPAQERVTAKSRKADRTTFQSKKVKEGAGPDDIAVLERLMDEAFEEGNNALGNAIQDVLEKMSDGDDEQVNEKAVSKKQQKFMGMVHAAQKGEKPASKEVAKVAKEMPKKAAKDFAATKHKGLPEKAKSDDAPKKKKEKTEEAGGTGTPTASSGFSYGKGIYDSLNRDLEAMIAESMQDLRESMSVNMSMNNDDMHGGPTKSLTVTATDEDAVTLSQLLKSAGLGGGESEGGCGCGSSPCSCGSNAEVVDENQPDWPTDTEQAQDNFGYSGGLNKPKSTGQTTVPVIASQDERQGMTEDMQADDGVPYQSSDDFFSQFEAGHFDDEQVSPDGMEVRGYIDGKNVMVWRFDDESKTSGYGKYDDSALGEQQSYAEAEEDALHRMMEMAGIAEAKKVDEDDVEEGNKFTGNLAKARAAGKKEADLDGDGDMEKVDESIFAMTAKLWKTYKG